MYNVKHTIFRINTFRVFIHGITDTELRTGPNVITKAEDLTLKGPRGSMYDPYTQFLQASSSLRINKSTPLGLKLFSVLSILIFNKYVFASRGNNI
jgi:hypothetical protein